MPLGATLDEALRRSGIEQRFAEIALDTCDVGIFGKAAKRDRVLVAGDRIEIYRPLLADPKEVRKLRAAQGKQMKKGGGVAPA